MAQLIEFSGRLSRSDKRPANPGRYDLRFSIHGSPGDDEPLWEESVRGVDVVPGGFFHVVLGRTEPLRSDLFHEGTSWVATRVLRGRRLDDEHSPRVPVTGITVSLAERLRVVEDRLGVEAPTGDSTEDRVRAMLSELEDRLDALEDETESSDLEDRLRDLAERLARIDGEEGRLIRIEDEIEDLVGPDGDVVDLNERMDRIEGRAPDLIESLRRREVEQSRERVGVLRKELDDLVATVHGLMQALGQVRGEIHAVAQRPAPSADDVGAVSRQGDVMTGGLTINRGGLEVLSGGVTCRGATVNTLEASNLVKAPKVIADAIELRGDFTVDNSHRVLQVRAIEGRQGSARKDGLLHLNGRGGAEVLVGTEAEKRGMQVHGPVTGGLFHAEGVGLAQVFEPYGSIEPGQVACMRPEGGKVEYSKDVANAAVIGVCVENAGLVVGGTTVGGRVMVALQGVAQVRASAAGGPIAVGTLLVSGPDGVAQRAPDAPALGTVLGKAVGALDAGTGTVPVLVSVR